MFRVYERRSGLPDFYPVLEIHFPCYTNNPDLHLHSLQHHFQPPYRGLVHYGRSSWLTTLHKVSRSCWRMEPGTSLRLQQRPCGVQSLGYIYQEEVLTQAIVSLIHLLPSPGCQNLPSDTSRYLMSSRNVVCGYYSSGRNINRKDPSRACSGRRHRKGATHNR